MDTVKVHSQTPLNKQYEFAFDEEESESKPALFRSLEDKENFTMPSATPISNDDEDDEDSGHIDVLPPGTFISQCNEMTHNQYRIV